MYTRLARARNTSLKICFVVGFAVTLQIHEDVKTSRTEVTVRVGGGIGKNGGEP